MAGQEAAFPHSKVGQTLFLVIYGAPALVPYRGASYRLAYMNCVRQVAALSHCSAGFISVTLDSSYEKNTSQLQMGRDTIHCGLWYVHSGSYHLLFTFLYCIINH